MVIWKLVPMFPQPLYIATFKEQVARIPDLYPVLTGILYKTVLEFVMVFSGTIVKTNVGRVVVSVFSVIGVVRMGVSYSDVRDARSQPDYPHPCSYTSSREYLEPVISSIATRNRMGAISIKHPIS